MDLYGSKIVHRKYLASPYASQQAAAASPNPVSAASIFPSLSNSRALASRGFTVSMIECAAWGTTEPSNSRQKNKIKKRGSADYDPPPSSSSISPPIFFCAACRAERRVSISFISLPHADGSRLEWTRPCCFTMASTKCLEDMPGIVCDNGTGFVKVCFRTRRPLCCCCSCQQLAWLATFGWGFIARGIAPSC